MTVHDLPVNTLNGEPGSLGDLAGHTLLVVALMHVPRHDADYLAATQRSWAFLIMAAGLVAALLLDELRGEEDRVLYAHS